MQRRCRADLKYWRLSVVGQLTAAPPRGYVRAVVRTVFPVLLIVSLRHRGLRRRQRGRGRTTAAPDVETTSTTAAESDEAQPAKVNLERFLMQAGEEPGFEPVEEPRMDHGVQSLAGGFSADEVERLRRAGFISITFQPLSGDDHNAGVTTVLLFKTAEGARDWLEYETSDEGIDSAVPGPIPKRFTVRGVPGARGWTGRDRHENPIGHVFWVQGRCEMVIGDEGEGDFVKPLR
jgi:hypothetical protein